MAKCSSICPKVLLLLLVFFTPFQLSFFHGKSSEFELEDEAWLDEKDDEVNMVQSGHDSLGSSSLPVTCQKNGRPDSDYEKWRWKPHGCSIPRFDALHFLGRMRRKRIMLVGDSIMRNQWESLVCLVQEVIPTGRKTVTYDGPTMAFHALVRFSYFGSLLVFDFEENAKYWRGVDVLVYDSAHWWTHSDKWSSWDYYMEANTVLRSMNPMVAYQKGLTTWAKWVDLNLDPHKTRAEWLEMLQPEATSRVLQHQLHVPEQMVVLKGVLKGMRFPVYLQDITMMSALRKDGHPSVYTRAMDQEQKQHPRDFTSDCSIGACLGSLMLGMRS
ncbi:Protein trichome birefringence-like 36 [Vitis vinifera]|uniref:Protein trichome birefringence-like 36 n=1 Tax=Vitis vinifera TaxID=29760 RepID=A0A438IC22_VITVI|nr:Protein trichome birefringence-like 36 [Vitis vinifera]